MLSFSDAFTLTDWFMKCDKNGGRNLGLKWDSQPYYYVLQTEVFLKLIWGKTYTALASVCMGSRNGTPQHLRPPSKCALSRSHEGLASRDTTHWGVVPCGAPRSRDGAAALLDICLAGVGGVVFTVHFTSILTVVVTRFISDTSF